MSIKIFSAMSSDPLLPHRSNSVAIVAFTRFTLNAINCFRIIRFKNVNKSDRWTEWCCERKHFMYQHPSFIYHKWHNMVPNPQSSSWLYREQSLTSPWRGLHGWLGRVLGGQCGGQPYAWSKNTNIMLHYPWKTLHYLCPQVQSLCWHTESESLQKQMTDVQTHVHSLLLFIRWGFIFTSYAQQIQRQTSSKPQTKFLL